MKITLASTSPFKNKIFDTVKIKHTSIDPDYEEASTEQDPYKYVQILASGKSNSVKDQVSEGIIIGLDTIVLINDQIVEKPSSTEEAKTNLRNSSNNETKVITGISLINVTTGEELIDYQESIVTFNHITEEDIDFYIANEPDAMYASGFIIETVASNFIKSITGSYYNILGVPVEKIYEMLNHMNIRLKDII